MKIKKGDKVKIMRGKDRGKDGQVLQIVKKDSKLVVEGLNLRFRHLRPRKANEKGQRVEFPAPIHSSSVMLVCPKCSKPTRVGYNVSDKSVKERACKKCKGVFS
jgi:large subunit ribosomal protein L24